MQPCKKLRAKLALSLFFWGPSLNAMWDSRNGAVWWKHCIIKCMCNILKSFYFILLFYILEVFSTMHLLRIIIINQSTTQIIPHLAGTGSWKKSSGTSLSHLTYGPKMYFLLSYRKESKIDYVKAVFLWKQWRKHSCSFIMNFNLKVYLGTCFKENA